MKHFGLLLLVVGLLVACGGETTTSPTATAAPPTIAPPTAEPVAVDTASAPTAESLTVNEPPTPTPDPTAEPTIKPTSEPPTPEPEPEPVQVISGQTPEGAFFLGDPNAPLTVIDYSDFL